MSDLDFGLLAGSPFLVLIIVMSLRQCYIRGWVTGYREATDAAIKKFSQRPETESNPTAGGNSGGTSSVSDKPHPFIREWKVEVKK